MVFWINERCVLAECFSQSGSVEEWYPGGMVRSLPRSSIAWIALTGLTTLSVSIAACGDDTEAPPPIDLGLGGGFAGTIASDGRLVIEASDGRVLLDGLPPGASSGDEPPVTGFATRDVTTTYEMQFGAFKPTVTPNGDWQIGRSLEKQDNTVRVTDDSGGLLVELQFSSEEDGHLIVDLLPGPGLEPNADTPERATMVSWGFKCDDTDHFAGLGAQSWDADHKGQTVPTLVTEGGVGKATTDDFVGLWILEGRRHSSHAPIPQYLSSRGYIFVAESDRRSTFALCSEQATSARIEIDLPARVHIFDGPTPAQAIERVTSTFGRPRMPPRVAFAPWLDAIFGSANVRATAQALRDNGIPSSVIWTEDWRGGRWSEENYLLEEEWEVDRTLYPDIEAVADDLHALGFDFHVYFNPFIYKDSKAWAETQPNGWLIKTKAGEDYIFGGAALTDTGMIDLDNPDARAWAIGKMQAAIDLGADGWMNDFAEWLPTDAVTFAGLAYERHNVYPVQWQEVARQAIDGRAGDGIERLFFARSGWFGTPQLVDVFWAGDQRTTFDVDDGLPTLIPLAIGLGIVGVSTYGHDIAGYQSLTNIGSTKELFFRWTSLGAWSPVMRTHHGAQPNKEWSWQKDAETIQHFKRYSELHMSLVPTLAGLARVATNTGLPMWRGLALHFPDDPAVWAITDEILLGDEVLIAPIQVAGATSRDVYLPNGSWYAWDGGAKIEGAATLTVTAPVEEIPVFVRAGGVIPTYPNGVMTLVRGSAQVPDASLVEDDRVIYVFLGDNGSFREDGDSSYELTSLGDASTGDLTATYESESGGSAALIACSSGTVHAACFEGATGPGTISISAAGVEVARLQVQGGATDRDLVFHVAR